MDDVFRKSRVGQGWLEPGDAGRRSLAVRREHADPVLGEVSDDDSRSWQSLTVCPSVERILWGQLPGHTWWDPPRPTQICSSSCLLPCLWCPESLGGNAYDLNTEEQVWDPEVGTLA